MRVLVGCEFSGVVREAFNRQGHDAWSVDFEPSEIPGNHIRGDIKEVLDSSWDLLVAFPPCTYLCRSGARWYSGTQLQEDSLDFVRYLMEADVSYLCIENPVGAINSRIAKPTQIIQPWWFGHPETKQTCLWLDNLPRLKPTNMVKGREPKTHWAEPGSQRAKNRSRTLPGIAEAMATQWGNLPLVSLPQPRKQ